MGAAALERVYEAFQNFHAYFAPAFGRKQRRGDRPALAVALTLKGEDTAAIVISVLYRGCAIPVVPYPVRGRPWHPPRRTGQRVRGLDEPHGGTGASPGAGAAWRTDSNRAVRLR